VVAIQSSQNNMLLIQTGGDYATISPFLEHGVDNLDSSKKERRRKWLQGTGSSVLPLFRERETLKHALREEKNSGITPSKLSAPFSREGAVRT